MESRQSKIIIVAIMSTLTFLFSSSEVTASNANHHITETIKLAETARIHGKAGHTKTLLEYAQESLTHARAAENELTISHQRITESIKHLEKAIALANQNDSEVATKHIIQALEYMRLPILE
ncbi:small metal-binding protein SmbP [Nitrosomonas ureae]|uniref:Small metal-binding protein n=1 Tax=Nitrosomonas ureae TaxID=44577 RepID=A0A1H2E2U7_9PROT|nr:small metal-binding protein SmbP [Nitrosomonas ureae]ALQ52426.1 metal-binding protein SmbP [Nitrosomonas ureae]SDT89450.1 Small metal-binding protein [Nitrosomonas ureae]